MGSIQVSHVGWKLPSGVELIRDVSFVVGNGERVALVGANGVGKSTLVRIVCGDTAPTTGTVSVEGRLGIMRQLVGTAGAEGAVRTVRDLLVSVAPERIRRAALRLDTAHVHATANTTRRMDASSFSQVTETDESKPRIAEMVRIKRG